MKPARCVIGVAEHTGWAHLVCVAAPGGVPQVVERRRVTLVDAGLPTQPYEHDTAALREHEAEALVARVKKSVAARTAQALERVVSELAPAYAVAGIAIRTPPFDAIPSSIADVRASYQLRCSADGMLYQLAICRAARQLDLEVAMHRRGDEIARAAEALGVTSKDVEAFVSRTGRPEGPPWTEEHRRAFAAAIAVLASRARGVRIARQR